MAGGKIMFKMYYFRKWGQLVIIKQNRNILMISDDQEENKMTVLYRHGIISDQERKTYKYRYGIKMLLTFYTILKKYKVPLR